VESGGGDVEMEGEAERWRRATIHPGRFREEACYAYRVR
jgi:hypothetical protein